MPNIACTRPKRSLNKLYMVPPMALSRPESYIKPYFSSNVIPPSPSMMSDEFYFHPVLRYSQNVVASGHCCPLFWDMRKPPESARRVVNSDLTITQFHLSRPATYPPMVALDVFCGVFPVGGGGGGEEHGWPIKVRRLDGVTVGDVLHAIYNALMHPIGRSEWEQLSEKQRHRIKLVFEERCKTAIDRQECRSRGVLRIDCLLQHTLFAGLSVSLVRDCSCILTLRRHPIAMAPNGAGGS